MKIRNALLLPLFLAAASASAQQYPDKAVQVVLPLQVGSASDIAVRVFAERMGEALKRERVKFDPFADFVPIHGIATIPTLLGVHEDVPARSLQELIALAKAKRGELNYATGGPGSPQHLAGEMFMAMAGIRMTQIPYTGATAAAAGLAGGQTQVMFIAHSLALPYLPNGKVRPIAFAGGKRSAAFPDLPTVAEAGVPGYDYSSWIALFAPKGTPSAVLARLRGAASEVPGVPALKERLEKSGLELWAVSAEDLPGIVREDHARWVKVVREANIKGD